MSTERNRQFHKIALSRQDTLANDGDDDELFAPNRCPRQTDCRYYILEFHAGATLSLGPFNTPTARMGIEEQVMAINVDGRGFVLSVPLYV